jgi:hypothetical protein
VEYLILTLRYLFLVDYPAMTHMPTSSINIQEDDPESGKKGYGYTQKTDSRLFSEDSAMYDWREFICGWGAAFINISITFPINKLIFRQVRSLIFFFSVGVTGAYF